MARHLQGKRESWPWLASLAIHATLLASFLLPLAEIFRPRYPSHEFELSSDLSTAVVDFTELAAFRIGDDGENQADGNVAAALPDDQEDVVAQIGDAPAPPEQKRPAADLWDRPTGRQGWPADWLVPRDSIGDAVQGVTEILKSKLEKGDLLVAWLMDESINLVEDRQRVAEKLEPFYKDLEARDKKGHFQLFNAMFGFGDRSTEYIKPTRFSAPVLKAIGGGPTGDTGKENVMSAVQDVIGHYGKTWKGMAIVVWTDESGDDTVLLEKTIEMCKKAHAMVIVVGPTSVLGSDRGTHYWVDKPTGFAFRLPVTRGPETALPEKLLLPYWHEPLFEVPGQPGAQVAAGMPWYGGPNREMLLSCVSPWALSRLAMQTGGTFTLLDHKEDQGPFKLSKLKRYFPSYGSLDEYKHSLETNPLRKAVSSAVQITYENPNPTAPVLAFFVDPSERYPFPPVSRYLTPDDFRARLVPALKAEIDRRKKDAMIVEQALAQFGKDGMDDEYDREISPRWRAWYDLNRGRLLAVSIRDQEYILAAESVLKNLGMLQAGTNKIVFRASEKLRSGAEWEARSKEAYRLLTRCLIENADTPWAYLAQWELDHAFGLSVEEIAIPPQQPNNPIEPPPQQFKFPKL